MDSTLIDTEVIDELAQLAGVGQCVKNITDKAMLGKIDFEKSLRDRVFAQRLAVSALEIVAEKLPITEGADD